MRLYIGGSPCTHWSIAQSKNRETEPSGIGWELFLNYVIGLRKFNPDYFLYENNKSMSPAIREQITRELGVEPILINSALVSAQNRQRLYWTNIPGVLQPGDRHIYLRDVLETGEAWRDKSYTLDVNYYKTASVCNPQNQCAKRLMAAERIGTIAEIPESGKDSRAHRVYSQDGKSISLCGSTGGGGVGTGLYAVPVENIEKPHRLAEIGESGGQGQRVYDINGKAVAVRANGRMENIAVPVAARQVGRRVGEDGKRHDYDTDIDHFQRIEINQDPQKTNALTTVQKDNMIITTWDGKTYPVYEVLDGLITIKGKTYPIKLLDGYYIIRKLSVTECKRLQTVPDSYVFPVSDTQAYKMLGNGWTCDVIAHILSHAPGITTEPLTVLSMYDGMSCGHIALDKLGATVVRYYATEIDKYAIKTTQHNYPATIQLGDAFAVRDGAWMSSIT